MRVALLGARGQLAGSLREALADMEVVALGRQELDITDAPAVHRTIEVLKPTVVINAAAIRKPDDCERDPAAAFAVNASGPRNVAAACAASDAVLVHFSTDNVFDGQRPAPYLEDDEPNPISVYGVSKLAGEYFVRNGVQKHYVIRTSALFGGGPGIARNFVVSLLQQAREGRPLRIVTDQVASPTYTVDVARKTAWLITTGAYGLYHMANTGSCSWFDFARAVVARSGVGADVEPITTASLHLVARRLPFAILGNGALERLGANDLPPWEDALDRYLQVLRADAILRA